MNMSVVKKTVHSVRIRRARRELLVACRTETSSSWIGLSPRDGEEEGPREEEEARRGVISEGEVS